MRARNLKPGLFKNEILGAADPLYTVVFEGCWLLADREGRLEDRPARIHAEINPYRPYAGTVQALDWLVQHRFLHRYGTGQDRCLVVVNFNEHQHPHIKEPPSKLPPPSGNTSGNPGDVEAPDSHYSGTGAAPYGNGSGTSAARLIPSSLIPDSGFRIPDPTHVRAPDKTGASTGDTPRPYLGPKDAWREVEGCDRRAYESWLLYRDEAMDPVPPSVRIEHAKFLAGKGSPEAQRELVATCIRLQFKRLHDPIANGAAHGGTPNGRVNLDQALGDLDRESARLEAEEAAAASARSGGPLV